MESLFINFKDLKVSEQRKISQGSVIPRPIAWVSTINENGSINLAPFSYFSQLSPTLLSVSFLKQKGESKHTYLNIMRTKEAVVHISTLDQIDLIDESSMDLDYNESEVDILNIEMSGSALINTPRVKDAPISFEVKLEDTLDFNKSGTDQVENNVVFLRIVGVHLSSEVYDEESGYILIDKLNPISRLSGPNYGIIKQIDYKRKHQ